jgi:hypothetical protein
MINNFLNNKVMNPNHNAGTPGAEESWEEIVVYE